MPVAKDLGVSPGGPPPGHHRPAAPADDPHQLPALVIIDLTHPKPFTARAPRVQVARGQPDGTWLPLLDQPEFVSPASDQG